MLRSALVLYDNVMSRKPIRAKGFFSRAPDDWILPEFVFLQERSCQSLALYFCSEPCRRETVIGGRLGK